MALYRDIDFRNGNVLDRVSGNAPTTVTTVHKQTERGLACETGVSKTLQYPSQLLPNGAFSVVVWAKIEKIANNSSAQVIGWQSTGNTGASGATIGIRSGYDGTISYPIIFLGSNNYKYFNWITDFKYHCFIFTIPGSGQTDITNSALYVDTRSIAQIATTSSGVQAVRTNSVYVGGSSLGSLFTFFQRIKVYDHVLSTAEIAKEQIEFEESKPYVNIPFKNITLPNGSNLVIREDFSGYGVNTPVTSQWIKGTGSFLTQQMFADSGIKKKGSFYLKCTSSGTIAIPCNVAYGQMEWDWLKGDTNNVSAIGFINDRIAPYTGATNPSYFIQLQSDESVRLNRANITTLLGSATSYITNNTWYRMRITRTLGNVFSVYILGGVFTNWTLVSTTGGSGTNPVTDANYLTSKWFVLDLDTNDFISDIKIWNAVQ